MALNDDEKQALDHIRAVAERYARAIGTAAQLAAVEQTAEATQDIKCKIAGIQNTTAETVSEIGRIAETSGEVDAIVTAIAERPAATPADLPNCPVT